MLMKSLSRHLAIFAVALSLGGCNPATLAESVFKLPAGTLTKEIKNPVTLTNTYQVKVVFAGTQTLVLKYQQDCFGSDAPPYPVNLTKIKADPVLSVQCRHRVSRYNTMKGAEDTAYNAIVVADQFISRNPKGNATSYVTAAWKAVAEYRAKTGG